VDWRADGDDDLLLRRRDGRGAVKAVVVAMVERRTTVVNFMVVCRLLRAISLEGRESESDLARHPSFYL
jgi:hypothetical protein